MKQAKFLSKSNFILCAGLLSVAVIGCGKEEITVYTAPKDTVAPIFAAVESTPGTSPEIGAGEIAATRPPPVKPVQSPVTWKTPAAWTQIAPTSMRVGNFSITNDSQKAEMAILPFPGSVGGELENVNRWRGEIGLAPVKAGEFTSEDVAVGSDTAKLYDLPGTKMSTLATWLQKDGVNWFFKMRGNKELVAKNKPVLIEFLKTIEFTDSEGSTETTQSDEKVESKPDAGPKWQTPSHWKEGPKKQAVVKNWDVVGEDDKKANVAISSFTGEAGGLVANVNRWRGQLSLPPMNETEVRDAVKTMETADGHSEALYVDFTGTDRTGQPARMVAAVVPHGGNTWYYKILGDGKVVEREKTAFLKMVQTASFH